MFGRRPEPVNVTSEADAVEHVDIDIPAHLIHQVGRLRSLIVYSTGSIGLVNEKGHEFARIRLEEA